LGTTKWTIQDEAEQKLFDKAVQIGKTVKFADLTNEQLKIVDETYNRVWMRGFDLFNNMVGAQIHYDIPTAKKLWFLWLGYFVHEASIGISQIIAEERIFEQKGKSWKQKEKEAKPITDNWVKVFTRKRFEDYIADCIDRSMKPEFRAQMEKNGKIKKKGLKNLARATQMDGSKPI
jgi:hypothetical protein